jgi:hypothetical protein
MCCANNPILRCITAILLITGIGVIIYLLLDDEHQRVVKYLLVRMKYLPDRYRL